MAKRQRKLTTQQTRNLRRIARNWANGKDDCDIIDELERLGLLPEDIHSATFADFVVPTGDGEAVVVAKESEGCWDAWRARVL